MEGGKNATTAEIHADFICGVKGSWTWLATLLNLTHEHTSSHVDEHAGYTHAQLLL